MANDVKPGIETSEYESLKGGRTASMIALITAALGAAIGVFPSQWIGSEPIAITIIVCATLLGITAVVCNVYMHRWYIDGRSRVKVAASIAGSDAKDPADELDPILAKLEPEERTFAKALISAFDGFRKKSPLAAVACLCLFGAAGMSGCSSTQAARATVAMEESAINYRRNMGRVVEAFIADYKVKAQAEADALADAAIKAETGADGKVNPNNIRIIYEIKAEKYSIIERVAIGMRAKLIAADQDIEHLLQYSKALKEYFNQSTSTAQLLNQSSQQVIDLLDSFIQKKGGRTDAQDGRRGESRTEGAWLPGGAHAGAAEVARLGAG